MTSPRKTTRLCYAAMMGLATGLTLGPLRLRAPKPRRRTPAKLGPDAGFFPFTRSSGQKTLVTPLACRYESRCEFDGY